MSALYMVNIMVFAREIQLPISLHANSLSGMFILDSLQDTLSWWYQMYRFCTCGNLYFCK